MNIDNLLDKHYKKGSLCELKSYLNKTKDWALVQNVALAIRDEVSFSSFYPSCYHLLEHSSARLDRVKNHTNQ